MLLLACVLGCGGGRGVSGAVRGGEEDGGGGDDGRQQEAGEQEPVEY